MSYVSETFGIDLKKPKVEKSTKLVLPKDFIGIEIELENIQVNFSSSLWRCINDHSLRNNPKEFILYNKSKERPCIGIEVERAFADLKKYFNTVEELGEHYKPSCSERTSIHVHLNVLDMSAKQIRDLILWYMLFEDVLYQFSGPERKKINYCVPLADSEFLHFPHSRYASDPENWLYRVWQSWGKYLGLNLVTMSSLGTIEIRTHRGSYDTERILNWANILMCLKKQAMSDEKIPILSQYLSVNGASKTLSSVFGKYAPLLTYPGFEVDMIRSARACQIIERQFQHLDMHSIIINSAKSEKGK